ncbi:tetratricopeptide repeat protein, partial [candidate division GN15 bacterium]|nr:tetratricopeptide repeat protein [candidate division GN15 bacterium]
VGELEQLIERLRHDGPTHKFAKAKYLLGMLYSLLGKYSEAREVLLESFVHYNRCQDYLNCATSLNRLSYVESRLGNIEASERYLIRCRDMCLKGCSPMKATLASVNLACLYYHIGNLNQSVKCYKLLAGEISSVDPKAKAIYHFMRPVPVALKGDTTKALELIEQARPLVEPFPREKAIFFENLGLIYLLDNQLDRAAHALEQGMEISLRIAPESTLVSQIGRLQADVALAGNKHDSARTHLQRALKVAEQVGERLEIAACWRVQAELSAHDGDHAQASDLYRRATDLLKQIGARYELAVTQYRAAVSGLFAQGKRLALLHLAREYFESENVTPYLERIDTELSGYQQHPMAPPASDDAPMVIASSKAMRKIVNLSAHIAQSDMTVLLTGETGTGKDLLARYIHHCSGRTGDFVSVNTAAVPNEMVEAELFGYSRGAFTGAERDRVGLVQQAHEGTLYLNEIADATAEFQAKLLEVLEFKAVRRLGENEPRNVNVRIIAATNRDLQQWLTEGRFRLDLYHRLNEVPIHLPPLRDRIEDIQPLVQAFLKQEGANGQLDKDALARLSQLLEVSAWPGNVRQLQAEIKRLWMTADGDTERLISLVAESSDRRERANLITLLEMADWNRREVARQLGMSEGAVRKRMARYDIAQEVVES